MTHTQTQTLVTHTPWLHPGIVILIPLGSAKTQSLTFIWKNSSLMDSGCPKLSVSETEWIAVSLSIHTVLPLVWTLESVLISSFPPKSPLNNFGAPLLIWPCWEWPQAWLPLFTWFSSTQWTPLYAFSWLISAYTLSRSYSLLSYQNGPREEKLDGLIHSSILNPLIASTWESKI